MTTATSGRARISSGPGSYQAWDGTGALEAFAGPRWLGTDGDGSALILGRDGQPLAVRPGQYVFAQDGLGWLIVLSAEVWDAWSRPA